MNKFHFPHGIRSYLDTHYEVSQYFLKHEDHPTLVSVMENSGKEGLYLLATSITNDFELNIKAQLEANTDVPYQEALQFFIAFKLKDAL